MCRSFHRDASASLLQFLCWYSAPSRVTLSVSVVTGQRLPLNPNPASTGPVIVDEQPHLPPQTAQTVERFAQGLLPLT